jgi:hypothetical protein
MSNDPDQHMAYYTVHQKCNVTTTGKGSSKKENFRSSHHLDEGVILGWYNAMQSIFK